MKKLTEIEISKTFTIGGIEFIKFSDEDGITVAVTKDILFNSDYGANNNFANSRIIKRLNEEVLPGIIQEIGEENILEFETDLTSLDGLKTYGTMKSKISIPTFDFYRENVKIFDMHKINNWWWLATPDTTPEHLNDYWSRCVSPAGHIGISNYDYFIGVRPVLRFVSSISVSSGE